MSFGEGIEPAAFAAVTALLGSCVSACYLPTPAAELPPMFAWGWTLLTMAMWMYGAAMRNSPVEPNSGNMNGTVFVQDFAMLYFTGERQSVVLALTIVAWVQVFVNQVCHAVGSTYETYVVRHAFAMAGILTYAIVLTLWQFGKFESTTHGHGAIEVSEQPWIALNAVAATVVMFCAAVAAWWRRPKGDATDSPPDFVAYQDSETEKFDTPTTAIPAGIFQAFSLYLLSVFFEFHADVANFACFFFLVLVVPYALTLYSGRRCFWYAQNLGILFYGATVYFPFWGKDSWPIATSPWVYQSSVFENEFTFAYSIQDDRFTAFALSIAALVFASMYFFETYTVRLLGGAFGVRVSEDDASAGDASSVDVGHDA